MVNQSIAKAKITHIESYLQRLKEKQNITVEELKKSLDSQDIVLHNLQLAIQGCIDLSSHIISDEGWAVPDTLAGLFDILAQHNITSDDLCAKLKKMVGFRNIIIHEYGTIDLNKVHAILIKDIKDIYQFLKQVCVYAKV